jgi:hypothetical protein
LYPIAHAWLVERLVANPQPAHYLGCVWPDMLYASPLTHAQSHRSGRLLVGALPADGSAEAATAGDGDAFLTFCTSAVGAMLAETLGA